MGEFDRNIFSLKEKGYLSNQYMYDPSLLLFDLFIEIYPYTLPYKKLKYAQN